MKYSSILKILAPLLLVAVGFWLKKRGEDNASGFGEYSFQHDDTKKKYQTRAQRLDDMLNGKEQEKAHEVDPAQVSMDNFRKLRSGLKKEKKKKQTPQVKQPVHVVRRAPKKPATHNLNVPVSGFFCFQGDQKEGQLGHEYPMDENMFFEAIALEQQKLKDGSSVVFQLLQECPIGQQSIPKDALLYGKATFSQDRVHINISVAKHNGKNIPVRLAIYDQDFLLRIEALGVHPSLKTTGDKLLNKAGTIGQQNEFLGEIGNHAGDIFRESQRTKIVTLERKIIYITPYQNL